MKVLIESIVLGEAKHYRLLTDTPNVSPICLTNLFQNYIKAFHLENSISGYSISTRLNNENEITKVFCELVNRELGINFIMSGDRDICIFSCNDGINNLRSKLEAHIKERVPLINSLLSDEKIFTELSINRKSENSESSSVIDLKVIKNIEQIIREKKLEIYTHIMILLIEMGLIESNDPIPLIFNIEMEDLFYFPFGNDTFYTPYPLELAWINRNFDYIQKVIEKGGYRYPDSHSLRNKFTDLLVFILKNSRTDKHISLIYDLFERDKEVSKDLFTRHTSCDGKEYLSMAGGREVLLEAYKACLRINSIESIKRLLSFQGYNLMKCLQGMDVFSPQTTHIPEQFNLSSEVHRFIEHNIANNLRNYRDYDPKEHGIWGYNAVTGAPIYEWQMRDIDSQKW